MSFATFCRRLLNLCEIIHRPAYCLHRHPDFCSVSCYELKLLGTASVAEAFKCHVNTVGRLKGGRHILYQLPEDCGKGHGGQYARLGGLAEI